MVEYLHMNEILKLGPSGISENILREKVWIALRYFTYK